MTITLNRRQTLIGMGALGTAAAKAARFDGEAGGLVELYVAEGDGTRRVLLVGVGAGALVIPLILNLLNQAFGFEGGPPAIVEGAKTLAAPQATLISALARGVIGGDLRWDLIAWARRSAR